MAHLGDWCPPRAPHGGLHAPPWVSPGSSQLFPEKPGWLMRPVGEIPTLPSPGENSAAVPRLQFPQDFLSGQSRGQQGGVRPSTPQPPALALLQEALPGARGGVGERRGEEESGESQGEPPDKAGLETLGGCSSGPGLGPAPRSLPSCRPARAVTGARG